MNPSAPGNRAMRLRRPGLLGLAVALVAALVFSAGCATTRDRRAPGFTSVTTQPVRLPARLVSNFLLVEAKQGDGRTYRFMVDTGSSATLVSPTLAAALKEKERKGTPPRMQPVRGANGREISLPAVTLRLLALGSARFERVPALVYDFADLSGHLGLQIDGVIGFPLFRDTLLTLDYPESALEIAPNPLLAPVPGRTPPQTVTLTYNNEQSTPLIPVQMGNESFIVLIDSGSAVGLCLNPAGLHPRFASGPRPGKLAASLGGDQEQYVGRLALDVSLGRHVLVRPVVDLTDQLSSLGGEVLRNFQVTFDQRRSRVTFTRKADGPILLPPRRDTGVSFRRYPAYWSVLAKVPDSPAAKAPFQKGDLCVRVNGEPVSQWDFERYTELMRTARKVTYTFIAGPKEQDYEVEVFDLVP